ncbi:MAG: hypothetical protein FWE97_04250, partial [Dehalococcoidia bacterium]|nr:hypothetical protein [Dehalococcoidia bacterium]
YTIKSAILILAPKSRTKACLGSQKGKTARCTRAAIEEKIEMKRALFENVKVTPYTSGGVIDRANFLSLVVGVVIATAGTLTLTATECDAADGTFTAVKDTRPFVGADVGGALNVPVAVGNVVNVDVDLVGLKQFV